MRYRVCTERGGAKKVIWDIEESNMHSRYPTLSEICEAASKEFSGTPLDQLSIVGTGGGEELILTLSRCA